MRLGVCGMLPGDFRTITPRDFEPVRAIELTSANFHVPGDEVFDIQTSECRKVRDTFATAAMDLIQVGLGFGECLFDPDAALRQQVIGKINRGIEVVREMEAWNCLIRTGSLSPTGSYSPCRKNLEPESYQHLIETLGQIAAKAEAEGVTIVIETHALTIMGSPEINRQVVEDVGSERIRIVMDFVNHFQSLHQVYHSTERLNHIFDVMGPICPLGHFKDIQMRDGLVLHIDEEVPGAGELDMETALRRWHQFYPDGYMLLEHLPNEKYTLASQNVHRIAAAAGIEIH